MKENTWILVANSERAKLYRIVKVGQLQEIAAAEHPESRMKGVELYSEAEGRGFNGPGGVFSNRQGTTRHAYEPQTSIKDKNLTQFAKELALILDYNFDQNRFSHLYVVAESHFLGVLKKNLSFGVTKSVEKFLSKDIVNLDPELIWEHCEIPV